MATTFFNDINELQAVASYNPTSNKTVIHLLIDTNTPMGKDIHEECVLMIRGTPSQAAMKLHNALKHILEQRGE